MTQADVGLKSAIVDIVRKLGVVDGDTVMVHSGISRLADLSPLEKPSPAVILASLHEALCEAVGADGTLVTPAFFYDYARRGKPFHVDRSPPDASLGLYPRYMFGLPGNKRSLNPIGSLQAVGKHAETICAHRSATGFGLASPWTHLVELGAKCLIIGTPYILTFPHHVEALLGVPHVYNKLHRTPVYVAGEEIRFPVITQVRYLKYGIEYLTDKTYADLTATGILRTLTVNGVNAQMADFPALQEFIVEKLIEDPYYLLEAPPEFVAGEPPDDGPAGPRRR